MKLGGTQIPHFIKKNVFLRNGIYKFHICKNKSYLNVHY